MKRIAYCLLLPALLFAAGGSIPQTFEFDREDFVFDRVDGYDVVALPGHYSTSEPGSPNLPLATYNVALPPDAEITGVDVRNISTEPIPGEFNIHPAQRPHVLSQPALDFVPPKAAVYASDQPYPAQVVTFTSSGCLGGYRIAGLQVTPLQYVPARRELRLVTRLELAVHYESGRHEVLSLDPSQVGLLGDAARRLVRNPEQVAQFAPALRLTDDWRCDMMVVTPATLVSAFQPFAAWKTRQGIKTLVMPTESIYVRYPGADNPAKIRNCISDHWRNHGLKYVLLGGDAELVPVRTARLTVEGNVGDIATDLYYADLQWSWNSDRNSYYGEMTDTVDLFYDLYVGRTPVDNASDVALFFAKDTTYEKHPDTTYIKTALFGSTMLFNPFHGKVINHIIADLFPTGWTFNHLEDPGSGVYAQAMNSGYQLAHVAAHGNQTSFSVMSASEAPGLTNGLRKLNFVNSIACQSGWFDGYECLAEALVKAPNGGCVATMLNSRYGFGYPPGFGPSEMLDEQFYFDFILGVSGQYGPLCALSKDHFQTLSQNQEVWRWCVYELNLFGDPTLPVWLEKPRPLTVGAPASVPTGPQTVRITVQDGANPVKGALVCLQKDPETYARGWTNSQGWVDLLINPATTGNLNLTASKQNYYIYEGQIAVTGSASTPALVFAGLRIDDGNNARLDPGETADLYVSLYNAGAAAATGTSARLRSFLGGITLLDSTASYGSIAVGDTVEGDAFRVTASSGIPEGTLAEFVAVCTATEGTWQPYFTTQVGPTPTPRKLWADHDVGNMILSATSLGSIGTLGPYREGSGLKYPRTAGYGSIYFTSFAAGTDPNYVVDRWYSRPTSTYQTDWRIGDTLHELVPPIAADQEYKTTFSDGAHPTPRDLVVTQWSGSLRAPGYDDFVIITYDLENQGASALNGLYAGILSDFDINNVMSNAANTDNARRLAWQSGSSMYVGVKLLSPTAAANVSILSNAQYVTPSGMMTEAVKDSFLRGAIHLASGSAANYSCVVSAGPFDLAPGARRKVAFAFVGGTTQAELLVNADSAQSWYDHGMPVGVTYLRHAIDDPAPGGNHDGILNPGESVNVPLWIANRSDHLAQGVWGILRKTSADTLVTVTDSVRYFGTFGAGDSASTGPDGFRLRVSAACTNGYRLPVVLVCTDTFDTSTVSTPIIAVGAPQLVYGGILCWDAGGGNGNGKLDPGEQAFIALGLANSGLGNAANVTAQLVSGDARLTVLDAAGTYGLVPPDSTVFNDADRFEVYASGSIPRETQVSCTLKVTGTGYSVVRPVRIAVGMLTSVDPIPDGPHTPAAYYAYDDVDTFYTAHPHYDWVETRGRGTRLTLSDDQTTTITLPPGFGPVRYYGQSYTQVSISSNGFINLGASTSAPWTNRTLPDTSSGPMIAANWDDLYPPNGAGVLYWHDTANHRFVVQWDSIPYYNPRTTFEHFEILIYDTTVHAAGGMNSIVVQYKTAAGYTSSTVGIQDPTSRIAIPVLFNGTYHRAAAALAPGRAIRYTTDSIITGIAEGGASFRNPHSAIRIAPNPSSFRNPHSAIRIDYSLPQPGRVKLTVHDITGRRVRTLLDTDLGPGSYTLPWNRRDDQDRTVSAGVYVYRLETTGGTLTTKSIILD